MAGRFVYWMNVSLDLMIEQDAGELGGGDWMRITESLHREFNRRAAAQVLGVEGRVIYEAMESYWPMVLGDGSEPEVMREYAAIWTSKPKILASRTRTEAGHNTRIVSSDLLGALAEARDAVDGDIGVGGATIATQLLHAGMLDEILLFTHPVILGRGRPLFDGSASAQLDLREQAAFEEGVVMQRWAVRG